MHLNAKSGVCIFGGEGYTFNLKMAQYYWLSVVFIFAYVQNIALKKCFVPRVILLKLVQWPFLGEIFKN